MSDDFGDDDESSESDEASEGSLFPKNPANWFQVGGVNDSDYNGPTVRDYSEVDAPSEIKNEFWRQVLLFNIAIFCLALGVLLIAFEQRWAFGGGLLAVGVVAFVRGYRRYQEFQKD